MPALRELQREFARSLLAGPGTGENSAMEIYRETRLTTLVRALALNYPVVQRLVGADFFEHTARQFIRDCPPEASCLDDYGQALAAFLQDFTPVAKLHYLPDVARLEWAVSRALHARDAEALDVAGLAALDAQAECARFVPHPALSLLRLATPADAIWRAVLEEDQAAMSAMDPGADPVHLLIEREEEGIAVRRLTPPAWRFTQRLCAGEPLQRVLDQAAGDMSSSDEINALLADHLARGRFIEFTLAAGQRP